MERGASYYIRNVAAAVGLLVAPIAVAETYADHQRFVQAEAAYDAAAADACGGDPAYNPALHDSDSEPLPALDGAGYEYDDVGVAKLGAVVVAPESVSWSDGESPLPDEYAKGFAESFQDPYIVCTAKAGYREVRIAATKDGTDYPGYRGADGVVVTQPRVEFTVGVGEGQDGRMFEQRGSIRAVFTHENTHSVVAGWMKSEDPETKALLQELEGLYQQEYLAVSEQFRADHGPEVTAHLQKMKEQFASRGHHDIASAIGLTIQKYGQERGIDSVALMSSPYEGHKASASIQLQVYLASQEQGNSAAEFDQYEGIDMAPFYAAEALLAGYMDKAYGYTDEGQLIPFTNGIGGHAYGSLDEKIASTITTTQIVPKKVIEQMALLDPTRLAGAKRQHDLIAAVYERENPTLPQFMYLGVVAGHW